MRERYSTHARDLPDLSVWWSLVPALVYPLLMVAIFWQPRFYTMMVTKEGGIEWCTFAVLLLGVYFGVRLVAHAAGRVPRRWLVGWYIVATLGVFVFAGEEVSWGQHLGLWTTPDLPEFLQEYNDQGESNLHNFNNALDQGPTNLMVLATLLGFVLVPLWLWRRGETMGVDNAGYWFWPTRAGLAAAVGVLLIPWPKRLYEWSTGENGPQELRHSEIHEFYVAVMMTTYLASALRRVRALAARSEAGFAKGGRGPYCRRSAGGGGAAERG